MILRICIVVILHIGVCFSSWAQMEITEIKNVTALGAKFVWTDPDVAAEYVSTTYYLGVFADGQWYEQGDNHKVIPVIVGTTLSADFYSFAGFLSPKVYPVRIRKVTTSTIFPFEPPTVTYSTNEPTFTTLPNTPTFNNAIVEPGGITFVWNTFHNSPNYVTDYFLQISKSITFNLIDFETTLWSLPGATNAFKFESATPGTKYYFRVSARSNALSLGVSSPFSDSFPGIEMLPSAPALSAANNLKTNEFTANWQSVTGATEGYLLDVATTATFTNGTFVPGYLNKPINTTSAVVSGLTPNTTYHYRVRAKNTGGASAYPGTVTTATTLCVAPTLNAVTGSAITANSFTFTWNASAGATSYRIDVASDENFLTKLTGYNDRTPQGTSQVVSGLSPGTRYFYRVRAISAISRSADVSASVNTLRPIPVAIPSSEAPQTNSYKAQWNAIPGVLSYRIDVSESDSFDPLLVAYNDLTVDATALNLIGLNPGTIYHYRIRAMYPLGASNSSNSISFKTLSTAPELGSVGSVTASSFTLNWEAIVGADSYQLDVAVDENFTSILPDYTNLNVGNVMLKNITGLLPGKTYHCRLRSVNAAGVSANSEVVSQLTLPSMPLWKDNFISQPTKITVEWNAVESATTYELEVSTSSLFETLIEGYNPRVIDAGTTSEVIEGLAQSTTYGIRIKARNAAGLSTYSSIKMVYTLVEPPVLSNTTSITSSSFTLNWDAIVGADSYQLDVAIDENFASMLPSYTNANLGNVSSKNITGLLAGKTYYCRLRSANATGISVNSGVVSQLTLPSMPLWKDNFISAPDRITVEWNAVESATTYELEVSTSQLFETFVEGYNPKVIDASASGEVIEGLTQSTTYRFRVKARNATGLSAYSSIKLASTTRSDGVNEEILLSNPQTPARYLPGVSSEVSIVADRGVGILTVDFYHKKKSEEHFTKESAIVPVGSTYKVPLDDAWFDIFGMEYYFEIRDLINQVKREPASGANAIAVGVASFEIPISRFGTAQKDYHVISFPYQLPKAKIEELLVAALGPYKKSEWRFLRYKQGKNLDYLNDELRISEVRPGEGYWFISKNEIKFVLDEEGIKSFDYSLTKPFKLQLKQGWNQIGNPFPINLNWNHIVSLPTNVSASALLSKLYALSGQLESPFKETDLLAKYEGGFVFADEDTEVLFPVTVSEYTEDAPTALSVTRSSTMASEEYQTTETNWLLPIELTQGELINKESGIGMNRSARYGKDSYDRVTMPRFAEYVELNARAENFAFDLSKSIVPSQSEFVWRLTVASSSDEAVVLKWNPQTIYNLNATLILHDESTNTLLNMAKVSSYTTTSDANITIYYTTNQVAEFEQIKLGEAFPNPFTHTLSIPVDFSLYEPSNAQLSITDLQGRTLVRKEFQFEGGERGLSNIEWNGLTTNGESLQPGMFMYTVSIVRKDYTAVYKGKIIKQ